MTFSSNGTGVVSVTGRVTGPSGLTLNNSGTLITVTLASSANDYAGTTTIVGTKGILQVGSGAAGVLDRPRSPMPGHSNSCAPTA